MKHHWSAWVKSALGIETRWSVTESSIGGLWHQCDVDTRLFWLEPWDDELPVLLSVRKPFPEQIGMHTRKMNKKVIPHLYRSAAHAPQWWWTPRSDPIIVFRWSAHLQRPAMSQSDSRSSPRINCKPNWKWCIEKVQSTCNTQGVIGAGTPCQNDQARRQNKSNTKPLGRRWQ